MSWVSLSILAAVVWAIVNVLDKLTMTRWPIPPILPVCLISFIGLVASIVFFISYNLHFLPLPLMALTFLAGASYVATIYFYCYAVKWEDISRVIPLLYLTPFWIALEAHFFLNETLRPNQYVGIALLMLGAILISVKTLEAPRLNKALLGAVLSCFCFAINQVSTKYVLQHADVLTTFSHVRIGAFLAAFPFCCFYLRDFYRLYKQHGSKPFVLGTVSQLMNLAGLFIFVSAASMGYITLTNALVAVQPFFVLIFALALSYFYPRLLQEALDKKIIFKKIIAVTLMFFGVYLIQ